jgi:adenine/guanine phosphoribosyltransferase-like PRPP-binding protein
MAEPGYIEATTDYWQRLLPAGAEAGAGPVYRFGYPARLPDGRVLMLPIRRRHNAAGGAVASLIVNHASFDVVDALARFMAEIARPQRPEVLVGMPTLGLTLAAPMARLLGHCNYVPLGYSRKFWYEERLSEPVSSITTPQPGKNVYLDPSLVPRLAGRRVLVVDDAISSGTTAAAVVRLLKKVAGDPVGLVFAMCQGEAWRGRLEPPWRERVSWVFRSPLLRAVPGGWAVDDSRG